MIAETIAVGSNAAQIGSYVCDSGLVKHIDSQKPQSILDATCSDIDKTITILEQMESYVVLYAEHKDKKLYKELIERSTVHNSTYLELSAADVTFWSYISHQCAVRKLRKKVQKDWTLLQRTSRKLRIAHLETVKDGVQCTISQVSNATMVDDASGHGKSSPISETSSESEYSCSSDPLDSAQANNSNRDGLRIVARFFVPKDKGKAVMKMKNTNIEPDLYHVEFNEFMPGDFDHSDSGSHPVAGPSR